MGALDTIPMQPGYYIEHIIPQVLGPRPYRRATQLNFQDFMRFVGDKPPQQLVDEATSAENWLGCGRFTEAYVIPGKSKYVLRLRRGIHDDDYGTHNPFKVGCDTYTAAEETPLPQINFGQVVARLGFGAEIARRVWGQPFMWLDHAKFNREFMPAIYSSNVASIRLSANLPQRFYNYLAVQIAMVADNNLSWEPHSENLMLTPSVGGFSLVDVDQSSLKEGGKRLSSMIGPFIGAFPGIDAQETRFDRIQILRKSIKAASLQGFDFLEMDPSGMVTGLLGMGLRQCGVFEWFLEHLQEGGKAGCIPEGAHGNWQRLLSV